MPEGLIKSIYDILPLRVFTDSSGNYSVPTISITGDQVLEGTMYLVNDPSPGTKAAGGGTVTLQKYRLYAFIAGDWRDLTSA